MSTIYELQARAESLRKKKSANSISAEDTFGLHADELDYMANLERRADVLGIRKVYKTKAEMDADVAAPVGTDGKPMRFGQLASVWNADDKTAAENGMVYAWQGAGKAWMPVGKLDSMYVIQEISSDDYDKLVSEGKVDENVYYTVLE